MGKERRGYFRKKSVQGFFKKGKRRGRERKSHNPGKGSRNQKASYYPGKRKKQIDGGGERRSGNPLNYGSKRGRSTGTSILHERENRGGAGKNRPWGKKKTDEGEAANR